MNFGILVTEQALPGRTHEAYYPTALTCSPTNPALLMSHLGIVRF